jgi:hypothetical protein
MAPGENSAMLRRRAGLNLAARSPFSPRECLPQVLEYQLICVVNWGRRQAL